MARAVEASRSFVVTEQASTLPFAAFDRGLGVVEHRSQPYEIHWEIEVVGGEHREQMTCSSVRSASTCGTMGELAPLIERCQLTAGLRR